MNLWAVATSTCEDVARIAKAFTSFPFQSYPSSGFRNGKQNGFTFMRLLLRIMAFAYGAVRKAPV